MHLTTSVCEHSQNSDVGMGLAIIVLENRVLDNKSVIESHEIRSVSDLGLVKDAEVVDFVKLLRISQLDEVVLDAGSLLARLHRWEGLVSLDGHYDIFLLRTSKARFLDALLKYKSALFHALREESFAVSELVGEVAKTFAEAIRSNHIEDLVVVDTGLGQGRTTLTFIRFTCEKESVFKSDLPHEIVVEGGLAEQGVKLKVPIGRVKSVNYHTCSKRKVLSHGARLELPGRT